MAWETKDLFFFLSENDFVIFYQGFISPEIWLYPMLDTAQQSGKSGFLSWLSTGIQSKHHSTGYIVFLNMIQRGYSTLWATLFITVRVQCIMNSVWKICQWREFFLFMNVDMVMMYNVILYLKMHFNLNLKKDIH